MKPRPPQQRRKTAVIAIIVAAVALAVVGIGLTRGFLLPGGSPRPALKATELTRANSGGAPAVDGSHDDQGARALTGLGIRLLQQEDAVQAADNALVSPISIASALGMTANGAEDATKEQMESVLGIETDALNEYLAALRLDSPSEPEREGDPALRLSNSIWLRDTPELNVEQSFLDAASTWYAASVFSAPFDSSTAHDINEWVGYGTDGMIDRLLEEDTPLPEDAMLYLINALAFEGAWQDPYSDAFVETAPFTCEDGSQQRVDLMYSYEDTYLEADLANGTVATDGQASTAIPDASRITGFMKRYQGETYAFAALLPPEGTTVADTISRLSGEVLASMLEQPWSTPVDAYLPAFSYDYSTDLAESLKALGMTDAFDQYVADFSGMTESMPLHISKVLHKTHIDVDREGTRAAAVTSVQMEAGASAPGEQVEPKTVRLDRPFIYLIVDTRTNTPLFIGTYLHGDEGAA
ncbi:serpin family protein [Collinsella tanakaei]|nr:serpin family protein [Collinsella tanakaei]